VFSDYLSMKGLNKSENSLGSIHLKIKMLKKKRKN